MTQRIFYPVRVDFELEGDTHESADADTMLVIRDATGRTLDPDEIVVAMNGRREQPDRRKGGDRRKQPTDATPPGKPMRRMFNRRREADWDETHHDLRERRRA